MFLILRQMKQARQEGVVFDGNGVVPGVICPRQVYGASGPSRGRRRYGTCNIGAYNTAQWSIVVS